MEKAVKNKVAKAVVPAIDVMFQALRFVFGFYHLFLFYCVNSFTTFLVKIVTLEQKLCLQNEF